jgi:TPR repeat protein
VVAASSSGHACSLSGGSSPYGKQSLHLSSCPTNRGHRSPNTSVKEYIQTAPKPAPVNRLLTFRLKLGLTVLFVIVPGLGAAADSGSLPAQMRFCAVNCFILTLNNGVYDAVRENGDGSVVSTYSIERFDRTAVVLHRLDPASGATAIIMGQIATAGNYLINATQKFRRSGPAPCELSWGSALALAKPPREETSTESTTVANAAQPAPSADTPAPPLLPAPERPPASPVDLHQFDSLPPLSATQLGALPKSLVDCENSVCNGYWQLAGTGGKAFWPASVINGKIAIKGQRNGQVVIVGTIGDHTSVYTGTLKGDTITGSVRNDDGTVWPWHTIALSGPRYNLQGIWRVEGSSTRAIKITQEGAAITAKDVPPEIDDVTGVVPSGATLESVNLVKGTYDGGLISGSSYNASRARTSQPLYWIVVDADEMQYLYSENGSTTAVSLDRASPPDPKSPHCDAANTSVTAGRYAYLRGYSASRQKNYALAECWIQLGAGEDDGHSQAVLAGWYVRGFHGIAVDYKTAMYWATLSHRQNNFEGEFIISYLYQKGLGTPVDLHQANSWHWTAVADEAENPYELSGYDLQQYTNNKILVGMSAATHLLDHLGTSQCTAAQTYQAINEYCHGDSGF